MESGNGKKHALRGLAFYAAFICLFVSQAVSALEVTIYRPARCLERIVDPFADDFPPILSVKLKESPAQYFPELLHPQLPQLGPTPQALLRWTLMRPFFIHLFHRISFYDRSEQNLDGSFTSLMAPGAHYDFAILDREMILARVPRFVTTTVFRKHLVLSDFEGARFMGRMWFRPADPARGTQAILHFSNQTGSFLTPAMLLANAGEFFEAELGNSQTLLAHAFVPRRRIEYIPLPAWEAPTN